MLKQDFLHKFLLRYTCNKSKNDIIDEFILHCPVKRQKVLVSFKLASQLYTKHNKEN